MPKLPTHPPGAEPFRYTGSCRRPQFSGLKLSVILAAFLIPQESHAHIKWFCAYDTAAPPLPFSQVFMLNFTTVAVAFGFLMFLAYATDVAIGE